MCFIYFSGKSVWGRAGSALKRSSKFERRAFVTKFMFVVLQLKAMLEEEWTIRRSQLVMSAVEFPICLLISVAVQWRGAE